MLYSYLQPTLTNADQHLWYYSFQNKLNCANKRLTFINILSFNYRTNLARTQKYEPNYS